jgi:SAM-dependent methyltransferase
MFLGRLAGRRLRKLTGRPSGKSVLRKLIGPPDLEKSRGELTFWRHHIDDVVSWYEGKGPYYNFPSPDESEKVHTASGLPNDTLNTWLHLFQTRKYIEDLGLSADSFVGLRVLDVGCGPYPNLLAFRGCERHGIDPLAESKYRQAGFPIAEWQALQKYHCAPAERMPFRDAIFDTVIAVNAIDHVDNFGEVAQEIRRVLRPGGFVRMHVHYHPATLLEPMVLDDRVFLKHYSWFKGLRKISVWDRWDVGNTGPVPGESYAVWGN